jgi:hypothetical protein
VVVRELHEFGVAPGVRLDRDLVEDPTSCGVVARRGVGMDVGVDADHDIDHATQIGQTGHARRSRDGQHRRLSRNQRGGSDSTAHGSGCVTEVDGGVRVTASDARLEEPQ